AGYVDVDGAENARVVYGTPVPSSALLHDVRSWPSFQQGVSTPVGTARISAPFTSPTAHVPVVATTVPVAVDGRVRAYVELQLSTAALDRVLEADRDPRLGLQVVTGTGTAVAGAGPQFTTPAGRLTRGLAGTDRW